MHLYPPKSADSSPPIARSTTRFRFCFLLFPALTLAVAAAAAAVAIAGAGAGAGALSSPTTHPLLALLAQLTHLTTCLSTAFGEALFFARVGVYSAVVWTAVVSGQMWVLDVLGGRDGQVCGNKFVDCRPWD
ncbi:hypothetical protein SVAN01_01313 [Stagonosporopsis vannaccii]|nr:hypothetical protein SVAN01_01313 [Stagonosporopsis vannaccii]